MPRMCGPGSETSMEHDDVERDFFQLSDSNMTVMFYLVARKFAIIQHPQLIQTIF